MSNYDIFADYYDTLTANAEYEKRAQYITKILNRCGHSNGILLDLACGSGTLSFLMEKAGFDVIGVDKSPSMLNKALVKKGENSSNALFLNQDASQLDLFGTINVCICTLDSINHFGSEETLSQVFSKIGLFMEKGGIFIFDVNTLYKHKYVLSDNSFVYDLPDGTFVSWQNFYNKADNSVDICLDFFISQADGTYNRCSEDFTEYYFSDDILSSLLRNTGFEVISIYDDLSFNAPDEKTQREVFVCKKIRNDNKEG